MLLYLQQQRQRLHRWLYNPHGVQIFIIDIVVLSWIVSVILEVIKWLK